MEEVRKHLTEAVAAIYDYVTLADSANRDNRRAISIARPDGVVTYNSGAFRSRAIGATFGRIAISADGYRVRENRAYGGSLLVLVGDGRFVFPRDDSRSHHDLSLRATDGARIVNVTNESGPWWAFVPEVTERVKSATRSVEAAISEWDADVKRKREQSRQNDLMEAALAVM